MQDAVLFLGTLVMIYMILFPPFVLRRKGEASSYCYSFIATPPKRFGRRCVINMPALLNQMVACCVVFGLLDIFCE
ncbi:hypothetical protein GGQ74_002014 [Desulfobaculum xiamenense]|uniref:Uncharacterized protein n=1 Tax=Desulfobaculum xiamenense TaxID=995050 RepID=A0A846QJL9_9BACT|nr:hypothetical protein [Desulfobaculum xiamenense]NJB68341.1 hypothetical protein [Desulfobaculum xiamenense]